MAKKTDNPVEGEARAHKAGALDIRNVIGILLATYGVILVLLGVFADTEPDKTGDVNANLWAGLVMLVIGGAFLAWARIRPLVVPHTTGD
jgi:hypothetical protein